MAQTGKKDRGQSRSRRLMGLVGLGLLATAAVKELRTPAGQRTWHGDLFGFVPYDLRPPTLSRLRDSVWQPDTDKLFLPRGFGVGWSVNFARILQLANRGRGAEREGETA
jgi:hypothetical protein